MGIVKFKTSYSADKIVQVEVLRETEACVYLPAPVLKKGGKAERREAKVSSYDRYHDSWLEAHTYLMGKAQMLVNSARRQLEAANGKLGNIKGMKPPKEAS